MTSVRGPKRHDITDMLNTRLRSNPVWESLFKAVNTVFNQNITEPRRQLATIRDPSLYHRGDWVDLGNDESAIINRIVVNGDGTVKVLAQKPNDYSGNNIEFNLPTNLKDRDTLIKGAQRHGFNYFSDTLTDADYARLNRYVEQYWPEAGTEQFIRFLGYIKGMYLDIDQLWSFENDAADEYPELEAYQRGKGAPVWEGGKYYPTSHVQLRYDALNNTNIDHIDLFYLFYLLAPIHLVLQRIVGEIKIEVEETYHVDTLVAEFSCGALDLSSIEATSELTYWNGIGQLAEHASGWLVLDDNLAQQSKVAA